jgi:hypothetical protein
MKRLILLFAFGMLSQFCISQVLINNKQIKGLANATDTFDAVNARTLQTGSLIYAPANGTNTITVNLTPSIASYTPGMVINFKAFANNTSAVTINVNGLGAKNIYKNTNVSLTANDIINGQVVSVIYDGSNFQLLTINTNTQTGSGNGSNSLTLIYLNNGF